MHLEEISPREGDSANQRCVLIVDDMPLVLTVAEAMIRTVGYSTEATTDPLNALQRILDHPDAFCAVVTDFDMPGLNGLQLARLIRRTHPTLPLLFFSSSPGLNPQQAIQEIGCAAHLEKPASLAEFRQTLAALMHARPHPVTG